MTRASIVVLWLLVAALAALFALAPATWIDRRVAAATAGRIRIADEQGTVWHGRGAVADALGTWRVPVTWSMSPLALAKGAVDVTFGTQPGIEGARGRVTLEDDTIRLTDFELKAPADALRTLAPSPAPWRAGGEWIIDAASFRYGANRAEGALNARWQRARLATGVYALDLGTLTVHFASQGSALAGTLANIGGDAKIDGNIAIAASGMTLNLNIAPGPGVAPDIARMLAALGTVDANGVVHAQWRTGK